MQKIYWIILATLFVSMNVASQSRFDDTFSKEKMEKDLLLFIKIREAANSGLYKYRSKAEIDSLHNHAFNQIAELETYGDFYNLICEITAFEGSCHNSTEMNEKISSAIKAEKTGYFPYPIRKINKTVRINFQNDNIPLGAEIIKINDTPIDEIIQEISIYANSDGNNSGGKNIFFDVNFGKYYRYRYGINDSFNIAYKMPDDESVRQAEIKSISYKAYYNRYDDRHFGHQEEVKDNDVSTKYSFEITEHGIAILSLHTFSIDDTEQYQSFLDSCLLALEKEEIKSLIVDVRRNGGGSSPHDMLALRCFTSETHKEIKSAWTTMTKIPYWRYTDYPYPFYAQPIVRRRIQKELKASLKVGQEGRFYYDGIKEYKPHENAYTGKIYLLLAPNVASAASIFASMMMSHTNAVSFGEETLGAYYGHNGVLPIVYKLPKSGIRTIFSIVNLEQDVFFDEKQFKDRGIIPDVEVQLSIEDFINKEDTCMKFVLSKIRMRN